MKQGFANGWLTATVDRQAKTPTLLISTRPWHPSMVVMLWRETPDAPVLVKAPIILRCWLLLMWQKLTGREDG